MILSDKELSNLNQEDLIRVARDNFTINNHGLDANKFISSQLGITTQTWWNWYNGKTHCDLDTLIEIGKVTGSSFVRRWIELKINE